MNIELTALALIAVGLLAVLALHIRDRRRARNWREHIIPPREMPWKW